MASHNSQLSRKWLLISVFLSILLVASAIFVALRNQTKPLPVVAAENKTGDANQPRADPNSPPEQKDPNKIARPKHTHPAFKERIEERTRMVAAQMQARDVNDPNVLKAMRTVPRHAFVPDFQQRYAYADHRL
jgi:hypothetical protein